MMKRKLDRLERIDLEIKMYNKIHNTHYSYGEYLSLVKAGKINSEEILNRQNEE